MSPRKPPAKFRNRLLAAMTSDDQALLQPQLQAVALERNKMIEFANRKIDHIYFPEAGLLSVVGGATKPNRETEIGIIGHEGMSGLPIVYGDHRSPHQTFVQMAGEGYRLPVLALREALNRSPTLQQLLLRYAQAFMTQTTHTGIANARGTLEERLCRWVLMAQDRNGDELHLTHEFLSLMLAVRRPGVTEALHDLSKKGLIRPNRGSLVVIDREGLIEGANGLYGVPEAEYERLIGTASRRSH